jgi:hypothetical protein
VALGTDTRAAAAAGEGRTSFVNYVLNDFVERTGMAVSEDVRSFILGEVLRSDRAWMAGLRRRQFNANHTAQILTEALNEAARAATASKELAISDVGTSKEGPFYIVIHDRWDCPFPFIFC